MVPNDVGDVMHNDVGDVMYSDVGDVLYDDVGDVLYDDVGDVISPPSVVSLREGFGWWCVPRYGLPLLSADLAVGLYNRG